MSKLKILSGWKKHIIHRSTIRIQAWWCVICGIGMWPQLWFIFYLIQRDSFLTMVSVMECLYVWCVTLDLIIIRRINTGKICLLKVLKILKLKMDKLSC
jgi:hypothetical protein